MSEPVRARLRAMAMPFDVTLDGAPSDAAAKSAIEAVHRELLRADDLFSLYRSDTPLAALANGSATLAEMPEEVLDVLRLCETYRVATNGAFDAKRPDGVIDPTGIVKTWAVANATRRLGRDTALAHLGVGRCGCARRRIPRWYRGSVYQGGSCGFKGARCGDAWRRVFCGGDVGKRAGRGPHLGPGDG